MEVHWKSICVVLVFLTGLSLAEENYCKFCSNHVACRPPMSFGRSCGKMYSVVELTDEHRKLWLQLHNGLRSIISSGNLQGFPAATQMSLVQWNDELAKLAVINAKECYAHYDQCRRTAQFPRVGQNINIDREEGRTTNITQSIYRTSLRWFNEYEKTDVAGIQRYHIPRGARQRYNRFALMVQDRLEYIGCAAVQFYDQQEDFEKISWVCNYSVANSRGLPVYDIGPECSKCAAGKDWDFPNLCKPTSVQAAAPARA